jgi:mannan endo-1,4-beta-mannosidase
LRHVRRNSRRTFRRITAAVVVVIVAAGIGLAVKLHYRTADPTTKYLPVQLPTTPQSYLGVYAHPAPRSLSGVTAFTRVAGTWPDVVMYYIGWEEPFKVSFAKKVASHGAVPLVQIDPTKVSLAAIAAGRYDGYLSSYAEAVRAYRHPVILSFGHEMNGNWYSWGYQHTKPKTFVKAWQHIVTLFRTLGARNVTWLWTVNIVNDTEHGTIPDPGPWWPGSKYVTWVGIDGYYLKPSWQFAPLFGPTVLAVRKLTGDPILIAETAATTTAGQPAKIKNLFAGIRTYGLLGFVWYDKDHGADYSLTSPAAIMALRAGAKAYTEPAP